MPPRQAHVTVAVATSWLRPGSPRPVDAPALTVPSDVRGWAAGLSYRDRDELEGRSVTQYLLNDRVLIEAETGGWALVRPTDQPSTDPDALLGWVPEGQLGDGWLAATWTHVVDADFTALRREPDGEPLIGDVAFGTRFTALGEAVGGWLPVADSTIGCGYVPAADVVTLAGQHAEPTTVLALTRRFLGVRFLWAGVSPSGWDCSGLIHLCWRRLGVTVPRDAHDQFEVAEIVPAGREQPGDLYFFTKDGKAMSHVGVVSAEGVMVNACGKADMVIDGPLNEIRRGTFACAGRLAAHELERV